MDVTNEILNSHLIYGGSDNTNQKTLVASKSLNYANGASIHKPIVERITKIPYTFNFKDSVGLFGVENTFVRIDLNILDTGTDEVFVNGYEDPNISIDGGIEVNYYESALFDESKDLTTVNTYEPAAITFGGLPDFFEPKVSVSLDNLKTGNQYIDSWLDVRLYTKNKKEHAYNTLYLDLNDSFYIGFHARNTRRLPYNVNCVIGEQYSKKDSVDPEYLPVN